MTIHTHLRTHTHIYIYIYIYEANFLGCDFLDCCSHIYCGELKRKISTAVLSGFPQVSLVYQGIEMIQPRKYVIIIIIYSLEFFTSANADGLSLEFE